VPTNKPPSLCLLHQIDPGYGQKPIHFEPLGILNSAAEDLIHTRAPFFASVCARHLRFVGELLQRVAGAC
jgi:hypothetical protein